MDLSLLANNGIEALPLFLTSLSLGLLIGLERERNPSAKAGLRTFALVAILGTLVAMLGSKSHPLVIGGGNVGCCRDDCFCLYQQPHRE